MNDGLLFQLDPANVGRILVVNKHTNVGLADVFELSDSGFDRHNVKIKFFYAFSIFFSYRHTFFSYLPYFFQFQFCFFKSH